MSDAARQSLQVDGRALTVSHLDKVLWPRVGLTKAQLLESYRALAPALLPHLRDRLMTLARFPDGVERDGWYQMNIRGAPEWVRTVAVKTQAGQILHYSVIDDLPSLLWAANLGTLEFHPYLATVSAPEYPHALVLDLDPGAPAAILDAAEVALLARGLLEERGLQAWVKTSGRRGLHLYVPLNGTATYAQTRPFARALAQELKERLPQKVVLTSARTARAGKIFIDWQQNHAARSTVAPWSLRAGPFPLVSTPIRWEELHAALEKRAPERLAFGPGDALERLEASGDLFAPVLTLRQSLPERPGEPER